MPPRRAHQVESRIVSHQSLRTAHPRRSSTVRFVGLPTGSGIAIIFAALFTGTLISVYSELISWPYLALYAVSVLLVSTLVNPKGLFLTISSAPILFLAGLLAAGWLIARGSTTTEGVGLSRASVLAILYPLVEFFPVLAAVTLGSIAIAVLRIQLIKRQNATMQKRDIRERSRVAASNRRTTRQSRRARERTDTVTVEELLKRRSQGGADRLRRTPGESQGQQRPGRRSLNDDLYSE